MIECLPCFFPYLLFSGFILGMAWWFYDMLHYLFKDSTDSLFLSYAFLFFLSAKYQFREKHAIRESTGYMPCGHILVTTFAGRGPIDTRASQSVLISSLKRSLRHWDLRLVEIIKKSNSIIDPTVRRDKIGTIYRWGPMLGLQTMSSGTISVYGISLVLRDEMPVTRNSMVCIQSGFSIHCQGLKSKDTGITLSSIRSSIGETGRPERPDQKSLLNCNPRHTDESAGAGFSSTSPRGYLNQWLSTSLFCFADDIRLYISYMMYRNSEIE